MTEMQIENLDDLDIQKQEKGCKGHILIKSNLSETFYDQNFQQFSPKLSPKRKAKKSSFLPDLNR